MNMLSFCILAMYSCFTLLLFSFAIARNNEAEILSVGSSLNYERLNKACSRTSGNFENTHPLCQSTNCGLRVVDGLFDLSDVVKLHDIAQKGMAQRPATGGPTILDINTGYMRDSNGLENLYFREADIFSADDYAHYGRIISKLKDELEATFNISKLFFTSPTFITRLDATLDWEPQGIPLSLILLEFNHGSDLHVIYTPRMPYLVYRRHQKSMMSIGMLMRTC
jgi:hypothetical protein